ncbi:MAG: hypothetical protein ABJF89_07160 [Parasphingorhabdus sp.]|uniref:hypothetical protein n=1 Tax=Parasphingorhabdus sp. TaxID=2709688 RepID=UPI003265C82C
MKSIQIKMAEHILSVSSRIMPTSQKQWATAMHNEFHHIDGQQDALLFAIGCLFAAWRQKMNVERYEPILRWGIVTCLFGWAALKVYLSSASPEAWQEYSWSGWQLALIGSASIAYLGAGIFLLLKKWPHTLAVLLFALVLNSAHFMMIASTAYIETSIAVPMVFSLAVVSEEYFIWALAMTGSLFLWLIPNLKWIRKGHAV